VSADQYTFVRFPCLNCNDRALVHLSALKTMHVMLMGL